MVNSSVLFTFPKSSTLPADPLNYDLILGGNSRTEGAFRLIEVNSLISNITQPVLKIIEFYDIRFGQSASLNLLNLSTAGYMYTAISHVWDSAPDVEHQINAMDDLDVFGVDFDAPHGGTGLRSVTLSWTGLIQMAYAARKKGSDYFWLDLCCIDQPDRDDDEMAYQISIMADIYRYANNVIVMVGGAGCVQHADQATPWMDRAWTLQEAILNTKTFVCILWPDLKRNVWYKSSLTWKLQKVNIGLPLPISTDACCLIPLKDLLDMADADQSILLSTGYPSVNVLDGMTIRAGKAPRMALRAALAPPSQKQIRYTGVWRSMFMRTSTKAVDVVYSIMGIFDLQIDPFKKNRDAAFMFNDLIRKTAASPNIGAWAWLTVGGVTGNDIPPDASSGIIPRFPHDELNIAATSNKPPEMDFHGRWEWVGHHVDRSPFYIKSVSDYNTSHNINFMTHSQPHIINATMIPINLKPTSPTTRRVNTVGRKGVTRNKSKVKILSKTADCIYSGDLVGEWRGAGSIQAVFVGTVGDMRTGTPPIKVDPSNTSATNYSGWKCFLFMRYKKSVKSWCVVANGVWNAPTWTPPSSFRYIFNVGDRAQTRHRKWKTNDNNWVDQRTRRFKHTYGVEALREWLSDDPGERKIKWFGFKVSAQFLPSRFARPNTIATELTHRRDTNPI
jgi:hypothetical protein